MNGNSISTSSSPSGSSVQQQRQQKAAGEASTQQQKRKSGLVAGMTEWMKLPANHVNEVLACNFDVMKVRQESGCGL